jgi:hypothetical protein
MIVALLAVAGKPIQAQNSQTNNPERTHPRTLPLVVVRTCRPERDLDRMIKTSTGYNYSNKSVLDRQPLDGTDSLEAERIARQFVADLFPSRVSGIVFEERVKLSREDGPAKARHSIVCDFGSTWNGLRIHGSWARVEVVGTEVLNASLDLITVDSIVPNSDHPILSQDSAMAIFRESTTKHFGNAFGMPIPELRYSFLPLDNIPFDSKKLIYRPIWVFGETTLMVDAFDGRLWRDD